MDNEKKYLISSIRDYIITCPYLKKLNNLGINFLDEESNSFSIEDVPSKRIVTKYVDGSSKRQIIFVVASTFDFSEEVQNQINNSGFYEDFSDWIEENNDNGVFPDLKAGYTPEEIEVETSGYLYSVFNGMKQARYQIQCKFTYIKESEVYGYNRHRKD